MVRASPTARGAVLGYFGRVASLNAKRAAMRVDPNTVSSEGYIIHLHSILLRFAEPFLDAGFTKVSVRQIRNFMLGPSLTRRAPSPPLPLPD